MLCSSAQSGGFLFYFVFCSPKILMCFALLILHCLVKLCQRLIIICGMHSAICKLSFENLVHDCILASCKSCRFFRCIFMLLHHELWDELQESGKVTEEPCEPLWFIQTGSFNQFLCFVTPYFQIHRLKIMHYNILSTYYFLLRMQTKKQW